MKRVDEVYPIDINSTIGPTGTIKRLFRNRSYFAERGYDLHIFANHPIKKGFLTYQFELRELNSLPGEKDSEIMTDTINKSKTKSKLKSTLKQFIENHKVLSAYMLDKKVKGAKKHVEEYLLKDTHADIVVFHESRSCYHYCLLRKDTKARVVLFSHDDGSDDGMFLKKRPKLKDSKELKEHYMMRDYCLEHIDRIVFISDLARQNFCKSHPEYADKAITVLNGIDDKSPVEVQPSSDYRYRLVCTGSVCERKGQYIVIEAMHRLSPEVLKDIHFTVIGTGPDHAKLASIVQEYRLQEHVTLKGNIPNAEVHKMLCSENIYILMSNNEGLPISILEAMRAGLPVISTKIAGIPEEVDDRNGVLINPDIEQLVEVLNDLPNHDWRMLGQNSRKRFEEEFTFEIMRKNYADIFDSLLN